MKEVDIIGAGLAGCEAAWILANNNIKVNLYEQRPKTTTEVHKTDKFAELVCSNSFRASSVENAVGILKREMKSLGSVVIESALKNEVPAGGALAVDRESFSEYITKKIKTHSNINIIYEEYIQIDTSRPTIVATGPLTAGELFNNIQDFFGEEYLSFFDAVAPIIASESLDHSKVYLKSRYDKGDSAYLNAPMNKKEYDIFYNALINAKCIEPKDFELNIFEGCMPIEVMAKRGYETMLYGPLKPVGLAKERDKKPFAVVQLRQDNFKKSLYNLVGFQTHMTFGEQKRILKLIPGFENIEIVRYGVMHRNTFINSPKVLSRSYQTKKYKNIFFAGQITGVEGYVESSASGIVAGINMLRFLENKKTLEFPSSTAIGSLGKYITTKNANFQPMNVTFGIIDDLPFKTKKKERKLKYSEKALEDFNNFIDINNLKAILSPC